ncbi:Intradiol ring-cleavage dioxygenase [Lactarius akahatsu]|uniref:Intradiol ring-cleavage dioxygenase n=1 Tax=Lactarius akahatsu TaxID=416441 RepID=A0AAD4LID3_9AGAM|nr:Intradiol ring-cleavage dioxygenase [Lactarius akahatsu]
MITIEFLACTGQICTPLHQEFILLSDVLGMSALVDALNDLPVSAGTESSVSGPFFTEDAPDVPLGESSERKGEYLYTEGHVCTTSRAPIPGAVIKTWETDDKGFYNTQYADRIVAYCHGQLVTDKDTKYVPLFPSLIPFPVTQSGPGDLLLALRRHIIYPNHLHMI